MTRQGERVFMSRTVGIGFGVLLLLSGASMPSLAQAVSYPNFTQADLDHNNVVTQEEWIKAGLAQYDALDTNHDGKLEAAEIEAVRQTIDRTHDEPLATGEATPPIAAYDTDKDGRISADEFDKGLVRDLGGGVGATDVQRDQVVQQLNRQFKKADKDGDGTASYDDLYQNVPNATILYLPPVTFD